jgi:hypothetical protein
MDLEGMRQLEKGKFLEVYIYYSSNYPLARSRSSIHLEPSTIPSEIPGQAQAFPLSKFPDLRACGGTNRGL